MADTYNMDEKPAFLDKIEEARANGVSVNLTPVETLAYKIWLGAENGDPFERISNPFDQDNGDLVAAYDMLGMDFPTPPTIGEVIAQYEAEYGEGSFLDASQGEQGKYLRDNYVQEAWDFEARHEYYDTLGSYDSEGFGGYDENATYTYLPVQADNGNSGYQNLRPWDNEAVQMSAADLRKEYNNSNNLKSTFASADDFLNYVAEMNAAGLANPYEGVSNFGAARTEYENNPIGQAIFGKYANADGLQINGYEATNEKGDTFEWTGSSWMPVERAYRASGLGTAVKIAVGAGLGLATGQAAGILTGGLSSTVAGAVQGVLGSAVSQGVVNGSVDPSSLLQAALIGGIGGFADQLSNMDSAIASGGVLGTADDIVTAASDMLNMGYDDTLALLKGVASGAVNGGDLESIAAGAVGSYSSTKIQDLLQDTFGDTLGVQDWFKDGQSNIPVEALNPLIEGSINAAINGGMDTQDALMMAFDYFKAGGDVDFMLPDELNIEFGKWLDDRNFNIPGLDFEKGGWDIGYDKESGDLVINHDLPSDIFDGFENPFEGFDVDLKGGEGFDLDFTSNEAQALADSETFGEYFDPDDYDNNVILQYDQGTVDSIMEIIAATKQAGRDFDDSVLQPIKETIQEAGYAIDDNVLQPIKDGAIALYDMLPDVSIGGPNQSGPSLSGPDLPDVDTGGFDFPDLNFGKPFGDELEAFNPLGAPALGKEVPLLAKVKPQNAYDPRRAGSSIVSSMFSEYLG